MSATPPLVSIVTPCLDPGDRLSRCLHNVAQQTYPHVEHIVVDGGSTDGSVEILRKSTVKWVSEPDTGQSQALNKGFRLAHGQLLTWLNADDLLLPDAVASVVKAADTPDAPLLLYGRAQIRHQDGSIATIGPRRPLTTRSLDLGNRLVQPGTFFTRAALEAVGEIDEFLHLAMDVDLWIRLFDRGVPRVFVPQVLAIFEIHGDSKTGSTPAADFCVEEAIAYLKSGRVASAEMALGRAAAHISLEKGRLTASELRRQAAIVSNNVKPLDPRVSSARVALKARPEAGFLALESGGPVRTALRHLFQLPAWVDPLARRRSAHLGVRIAQRLPRRLGSGQIVRP